MYMCLWNSLLWLSNQSTRCRFVDLYLQYTMVRLRSAVTESGYVLYTWPTLLLWSDFKLSAIRTCILRAGRLSQNMHYTCRSEHEYCVQVGWSEHEYRLHVVLSVHEYCVHVGWSEHGYYRQVGWSEHGIMRPGILIRTKTLCADKLIRTWILRAWRLDRTCFRCAGCSRLLDGDHHKNPSMVKDPQ